MTATIAWVHVGDLHIDEADGWQSLDRLETIVGQVNTRIGRDADFVFLPGDNANHGTPEQYARMIEALAPLDRPWRAIPGDHDFEPHDLIAYEAAIPPANRPEAETIGGYRCVFLDIVGDGAGGPDFRVTMHHRNRIREELARAEAAGQIPLVFMHAYPGDLAADGDEIARTFADGGVAFVDTGHTHYNELLNDGRTVYGATRSTGQIEEDDGRPGFTIVCLHGRVPSWRFRRLDDAWPHVQIVAPCDRRLVTRPSDSHQVPRPGPVTIVARLFGAGPDAAVSVSIDGGPAATMTLVDGAWQAETMLSEGLRRVEVACGTARDRIELLVRDVMDIPKRRPLVAPGIDCHAVGAWPEAGIDGSQRGPNKNGGGW
ncbi:MULTISPECIES: metallophosphoesterase [unclassified Sphingomonas]|uniref:metallophosphoesterase family protein n=1 Tax=unclassified Sphingomonas TaxID=196159 RepID=UPI00226A488D|nr:MULTISPECIES: metallophosphoesterase [unclassified Sphingomonas]